MSAGLCMVRVCAVIVLSLGLLAGAPARADRIELVSRALPELVSDTAGGASYIFVGQQVLPQVSADGRWTVFVSAAPNLVAGQVDFNNGDDVFLYDRLNDTVTLVSRANGAPATAGNRTSGTPSISSDGRWIAFFSNAGDLVAGQVESNPGQDVFVYDRDSGAMTLVSHTATSNVTTGNNFSLDPVISANGNAVVFMSSASNLMAGQVDTGGNDDIFYWDRATNTTTLVTHIPTSTATAVTGAISTVPVISADGAFVAYTTGATNLMSGGSDTNGRLDVYSWSRATNTNIIVSRGSTSAAVTGNGTASSARISADGAFILFRSSGTNHFSGQADGNGGDDVFLFNRSLGSVTLVSRNSSSASTTGNGSSGDGVISADGNWVAFPTRSSNLVPGVTDANSADDVYLWHRPTDTMSLVTRSVLQPAFAASAPSSSLIGSLGISADGSTVAYFSRATNLASGQTDSNGALDAFVFDRATGTNQLGSGSAGSASATGNNAATGGVSLSADGQWLAFASSATDLLAGQVDTNAGNDVHLFGKATAAHALVSRRDPSLPSNTLGADSTVGAITPVPNPVVSADGRYTVFQSTASQMISGQVDVNGVADIFLYDRTTGETVLVSRANGTALTAGNGESRLPVISANGRWVAFVSRATNLVASQNDGNSLDDVFLWDRTTGSMALVSHSASGLVFAGSGSTPVLSADGSYVLFLSESNSIVPGQTGSSSLAKVYSYETATGTTQLVSHSRFSTTSGESTSGSPWISADGRFVAFASSGLNFVLNQNDTTNTPDVFQWDRTTDTFTLVSRRAVSATVASGGYFGHFSMSADGNWIAHSNSATTLVTGVTDTNSQPDLFLWERATNTNRLVSRSASSATTAANNASQGAVLSTSGNFVAFLSRATNLVSGGTDTNNGFDVFVYDRDSNTMQLASHTLTSTQSAGNGVSRAVAINADGGRISFQSAASNLVASDAFGSSDIFLFDPSTGQVSLASYRHGTSTGLIDSSDGGALSADGKVVAFSTLDRNVVPNDFNARQDVFLWISESGTDLAITKTNGVSSLVSGQTVTYLITAINAGPLPAGATVTDNFPAALQGATWTCAAGGGASCGMASGAGALSQSINLPVNGTVTFTVTATVAADAAGTLTNTASIAPAAGITDSNLANNIATDTDTITPQADLLISVSDSPDPVGRGATLTYLITMANAGPGTATDVTVTDTLPAGTTFLGASGSGWTCGHAGGVVTCTRPSQAPSPAVPAITIQVAAPVASGIPTLTNTVSISAATADPVANNAASTETAVVQPSILVGPEDVRTTNEAGGTAFFSVMLGSAPLAPVTVSFVSSNMEEGTVSPASVTFTSANWSQAQAVTVSGVDDFYDDGDIAFTILTSVSSSDPGYAGIDPADVPVTNLDDDTAGFGLTANPMGMITTEAGGTTVFTISLTSQPHADVTVAFTSGNTAEGTVSPASVTFTADDWIQARSITITGVDDAYDDGDVEYTVTLGAAASTDPSYAGLDAPDATVTNLDDDTAGITVTPTEGLTTTEEGGTATFTVVLNARPRADVTIPLTVSDDEEGTVEPEALTFTIDTWNVPQTVTVTGADDDYDDGEVESTITTGATVSTDAAWAGIDPADVAFTNEDDDTAGIEVTPTEGLVTTEGGGTATFTVVLTARPTADVTIALESSDAEEGQPSPATLTFTTDDWATPQTVTVTGQDDDLRDGDAEYSITLHPAQSGDPAFDGIDPADVTATNRDDNYEGVFYTVTPCRLVDTRQPGHGPALQNNQVAIAQVHGVCGIPPTARAVAMNLTFTGAGQPGTVLVYPGDLTQPPVAEYLWIRAGNVSLSLSTIMKLGADGTLAIQPKLKAPRLNPTVHIVLDVTGYFE